MITTFLETMKDELCNTKGLEVKNFRVSEQTVCLELTNQWSVGGGLRKKPQGWVYFFLLASDFSEALQSMIRTDILRCLYKNR